MPAQAIPDPPEEPTVTETTATQEPILTTKQIQDLLPHRWPFLLVDRIVEYDAEAKRIVGLKSVTATEWFFQGHFPGQPIMPGVLQVEALAQTMGVFVTRQPDFVGRLGLFAAIDECRFKHIVVPGDQLRLEVTMERLGSKFGRGKGVATVNGEVACEALISFIIAPDSALR
jgi:3-hydroxyacyl-[acyl-carrier-protein] dehydratase